jgi:hypothetical protein
MAEMFKRIAHVARMTFEHSANAIVILLGVRALELAFHILWSHDTLLFDWVPIRYLIDGMEGGVILLFVVGVLLQAARIFGFRVPKWLSWLHDDTLRNL